MSSRAAVMRWLLLYMVLHLLISILFGYSYITRQRNQALETLDDRMRAAAHAIRPWLLPQLQSEVSESVGELIRKRLESSANLLDLQIELILVDQDAGTDRREVDREPELVAAEQGSIGYATRIAPSSLVETRYLALALGPDAARFGFLRISTPLSRIAPSLTRSLGAVVGYCLLTMLLGLAAAAILLYRSAIHVETLEQFIVGVTAGEFSNVLPATVADSGWAGFGRLLTQMQAELKQRYQRLSGNNDRLASVLMSMNEGVLTIDQRRRVVLANRAALGLLDATQRDILQRPFYEVVRNPMVEECVEEVFRTHKTITREIESTRGAKRMLSMRFSWLPNPTAESVVLVVHDVTNIRQLETMRRDFVANVSHELKTPLASIKAYSETLRLGAIDDEQNRLRFVERIEEQANRLHELIMDLIQLARIEAGQATFELEDVDLCVIAQQRTAAFQSDASKRGTALALETPAESIVVRGDEDGIITILDNLITNAIRYTPERAKVTVRIFGTDLMGVIEVQDNGQGIAAEHHERIFERFYRVDRARSRDLGGTGLGLSIVKHLAQAMGGTVGLVSRPGKGCTFTVQIPLR